MLEVEKLRKRYGNTTALADVTFSLPPGICVVAGPNGAGKTTLLRAVTGAERADSGTVRIDGIDVYGGVRMLRHISYLSDRVPLYADLTVEDHLNYRGKLKRMSPRRLRARIKHLSDLLDLRPVFTKRTSALSAGQRKRVGIADAMLVDSRLLAIDEPFAGLDREHCEILAKALASFSRHTLVMLATHRFDIAEGLSGKCLVLSSGEIAGIFDFGGEATGRQPLGDRVADTIRTFYAKGLEAGQ